MRIDGLHLELTNKCILKCPKCARTNFIDKFGIDKWQNQDLSLADLKQFVDVPLAGKQLTLCGNYGDPIYYPDLFDLIAWAKSENAMVKVITNGSRKDAAWWQTLNNLLTADDCVSFSIDGIPDNFTQYRVNANWDSIKTGIEVIVSGAAHTVWKYIPFLFNQHSIDDARALCASLGIDEFLISPSDRWENMSDPLMPTDYIGPRKESIIQWHNGSRANGVDPMCTKMYNQHYISAAGFYMPCCFVGDHRFYYKSEFYKNRSAYDITTTTLTQVLATSNAFYNNIELAPLAVCTFNCPQL